jgi:hypothetical protein
LYVDNRDGDNAADGRAERGIDQRTGPVKTIGRALEKVQYGIGETIHIANQGIPYRESLAIVGGRFSGGIRIHGNGAVVTGAREVPYGAWKFLGKRLWKFTPFRKAYYQLISDDQAIPEFLTAGKTAKMPSIPAGQWMAWQGSIYYHAVPSKPGALHDTSLAFAVEEVGMTLLDIDDVVIQDLEFRHFRLDGINAHDRCRGVILERVKLVENGRAGLAVGGTCRVGIKDSEVGGNRVAQILNTELAQTELVNTNVESPVGEAIRRKGGTVFVDGQEVP